MVFQEICAKFAAKYAEGIYEIDKIKEEVDDNPHKQCQLNEKQKMHDLFANASRLLQFYAKRYLVDAYDYLSDDLILKIKTLNDSWFNYGIIEII